MKYPQAILSKLTAGVISLALMTQSVFAGMTISGTRIIFPGSEREKTVRTTNKSQIPLLVQVWVDDGSKDAQINNIKVPFTVTPPVYRVDPGKGQSVRLIYNGMALPQDRESVFWFNLLEIPPMNEAVKQSDHLELAFRTRIKIFYRPTTLKSSSAQELERLKWQLAGDGKGITVVNPTPYHFSFDSAALVSGSSQQPLAVDMVPPFGSKTFSLVNGGAAGGISRVVIRLINDYGSVLERELVNSPGQGLTLVRLNQ